ncbi:MAG TPA: hypothetical protein VF530_00415 [Planctomycetota bacterium]
MKIEHHPFDFQGAEQGAPCSQRARSPSDPRETAREEFHREGLPPWPAFEAEEAYLVLGDPLARGSGLRRETCEVIDELRAGRK